MQIPPVIKAIMDHKDHGELSRMLGLSKKFLWTVQREWKDPKYTMYLSTLDNLYSYFKIQKDEFYYSMREKMKKSHQREISNSPLGSLFRNRRLEMGMTVEEVAGIIKGTDREICRIELGCHLPAMNSWYVSKLLELYKFDKNDEEIIRWYIVISKDMKKIAQKYGVEKCPSEVMHDE